MANLKTNDMELRKNEDVIFLEEPHKYYKVDEDMNLKELSGITAIIKKCICPDLYSDVDEATLRKAAEHGTMCHKVCETWDNQGFNVSDDGQIYPEIGEPLNEKTGLLELNAYRQICEDNDLWAMASEYLVSDNENFASCIDKVLNEGDKAVSILDFKFTYSYHEEPVTWQTSFYADMLEAQNPGVKVKNLYCAHIKFYYAKDEDGNYIMDGEHIRQKKAPTIQLHKLKRVPTEYLEEAKRCYLAGDEFVNPLARVERELPDDMKVKMDEIAEIIKQSADWEKKKKVAVEELKRLFEEIPMTSKFTCEKWSVSQTLPTHSVGFDEERFKAENPEMWRKYNTKKRIVSARTTVALAKEKKAKKG